MRTLETVVLILSLISFPIGLIGILTLFDFDWGQHFPNLTRLVRARQRVQRIVWSDIRISSSTKRTSVFADSWDVFNELPVELFGTAHDREKEMKSIESWLQDDAYTDKAEEIYLIARPRRFAKYVHGLLYATVDKGPDTNGPNTCAVWYMTASRKLDVPTGSSEYRRRRLEYLHAMWRKLGAVLAGTCSSKVTNFFFFLPSRDGEVTKELDDYMCLLRTFLESEDVNAKLLDFDYATPDAALVRALSPPGKEEPSEDEHDDDDAEVVVWIGAGPLVAEDMLETIYAMHFWGFVYPTEVKSLEEIARRARYYAALKREVCARSAETIAAVELGSEAARRRGFTWCGLE